MIIGHIGLIQKTKKQDFVLAVIKELLKQGIDAIGLFPGEVRDSEYMKFLNEKVEELELKKRVIFFGRRNDIPDLLKVMDVLIIPSFEGFPLVGLEAISAHVPVVACDVMGAKEFIEVTHGGITYVEDDVQDAVRAIEEVIKNKEYMIEEGYQFALNSSYESYKAKIEKMFDSIQ